MSLAQENGLGTDIHGPADVRQRLHKAFKASSLRLEAERLNRPRDRSSLTSLMEVHRLRFWEANAVYRQEYATRVEVRMRELIDQRAAPRRDHRHPHGTHDRFSQKDLLRQARRDVHHDHEKHLARLRRQRSHDLEVLIEKAGREQAMKGKARDGFNRAVDRRTGHDRRSEDDPGTMRQTQTRPPRTRR